MKKPWRRIEKFTLCGTPLIMAWLAALSFALETGQFRILSISESSKLILVSQIPNKTKYLLDASATKITVDGKPAEFRNLQSYSIAQVKFELKKGNKDGVDLDGVATEIKITNPEGTRKQP